MSDEGRAALHVSRIFTRKAPRPKAHGIADMNIQLISYAFCPFVHRSTIMLNEKQVAYEITYIDLANKPPWSCDLAARQSPGSGRRRRGIL